MGRKRLRSIEAEEMSKRVKSIRKCMVSTMIDMKMKVYRAPLLTSEAFTILAANLRDELAPFPRSISNSYFYKYHSLLPASSTFPGRSTITANIN